MPKSGINFILIFRIKIYATESLNKIIDFAFGELQVYQIKAGCAVENKGNIRILEKVEMTREGRIRNILPLKDGWPDTFECGM